MTIYLTPTKNHWACDVEADGLLEEATRIWCAHVINVETKEEHSFTSPDAFKSWLDDSFILVGHNFISYDLVMLNRHWGTRLRPDRCVDTFVLAQLYHPNMPRPKGLKKKKGSHSLEAWGMRLGYHKSEHSDFTQLTDEMVKYCRRDTVLTALLFRRLTERMREVGFTERGAELEHLAWNIIQNKQRRNGFPLDRQRTHELYVQLRAREEELKSEVYGLWPPRYEVVARYKKAFKKDGEGTTHYLRHCQQYPETRLLGDGGYECFDWVHFNLGSPAQRVEALLGLGWVPVDFTEKGNPKVDEDSLLAFAELIDEPKLRALAKWIVTNSRANMLNTWLEASEKDGKIHGQLFLASTLRYRHSSPNSANIPAVRLKKGEDGEDQIQYGEEGGFSYEARNCWTAGSEGNFVLVGVDGTGIQNRCLIHSLIETVGEDKVKPFTELSLRGDIHKRNIEVLGLANKAAAKKFYYTLMMGGGGARLAADQAQFGTKLTPRQGSLLKTKIVDTIPGFRETIERLVDELRETGRIRLCDGTPIVVPSDHMVIPYKLQGDESRLMKQAMIYVDEEVRKERMSKYVFKVADIHDEWQLRVHRDCVEDFISLALPCFPRAGDSFGYRILIEGDAKVGNTWAETH